jgi:hypothetical protein
VLVFALVGSGFAAGAEKKNAHQKHGEVKRPPKHPPKEPIKVEIVNDPWATSPSSGGEERECPQTGARPVDSPAEEMTREPKGRTEFTVRESNPVMNFGPGRGTQEDYVVLIASKELPKRVTAANFEIDTVEPMRRIGEASLLSSHLPPPTFTRPHFFNHRTEISFTLCVKSGGKDAGTYTGQFQFISPGAIETATLTQTAQLKAEESTFIWWFVGVLLLAAVLLGVNQLILPDWPTGRREWLARSVVIGLSLAAAASAMLVAWSQNATWGENIWVAVGALIGTAFAAAGLGGTLSAAAGQIRSPNQNSGTNEKGK